MKNYCIESSKESAFACNRLAREQFKLKMLQDIRIDIEVCRLEGWDFKKYLWELKSIVDDFLKVV